MVNDSHEPLDASFNALAHPIRRGIVERLALGPATVGEASRDAGVSKPAITKHLRVLEDAGLIERVVVGRTHQISLRDGALGGVAAWMERQRALWERKLDVVEQYIEEQRSSTPTEKESQ
jgi:DNA-binding transcriptional ArsR family regulator